jgi:hypothetical protein
MEEILYQFVDGLSPYQLVQDFVHPQYVEKNNV